MRMQLRFLGTGAAFSLLNYQSNLLIEEQGQRLLVDAGADIRFALRKIGLSYKDIQYIYITHLHNDHIGGMEFLAFSSYFDPTCPKPHLYCHKWLVDDLWSFSLKGGLASIQGQILNLHDYFEVHGLGNGERFTWQQIQFDIIQAVHVYNGYWVVPTFGLFIIAPDSGKKVYLTSDTQLYLEYLSPGYAQADLIIQDCETSSFRTGVHSHYEELRTLASEIKAKMYLWHYQDNVTQEFDHWQEEAHQDGFAGFLAQGEVLTL
jgi:ribonuclease BN (tRNA processing enzyme)